MRVQVFHVKDWLENKRSIHLNKDNIELWKREYDRLMFELFHVKNYSNCLTNKQWLEDWQDWTPKEAVDEEMSCY